MVKRPLTAALALSFAALVGARAKADPRHINGFNIQWGGTVIPNGKAVPLSGVWTNSVHPGSQLRTSAALPPKAAAAGNDVLVTHIDGPFPTNEPAIAVDPTNSNHLIASANDYRLGGDGSSALYSSRNGRASWNDKNGQWVNSYPYYF